MGAIERSKEIKDINERKRERERENERMIE
jgi:hypothetical protein